MLNVSLNSFYALNHRNATVSLPDLKALLSEGHGFSRATKPPSKPTRGQDVAQEQNANPRAQLSPRLATKNQVVTKCH